MVELASSRPSELSWPRRVIALQDLVLLGYFTTVRLLVACSEGPGQQLCARRIDACLLVLIAGCALARGSSRLPSWLRRQGYRLALCFVAIQSYLMLRELLPLLRSDSLDPTLHRIDLALFGCEPALWLQRFNTPPLVEWFSFFYFSYFLICGGYLVVMLWLLKPGRHTHEFALGCLLVLSLGQLGYLLVPGYGPVGYLADQFRAPLAGGFFWRCVLDTVQAAGAHKDIFPSLHTALPSWLTLFALRRARFDPRWRWPARITGFFAANIIVSTMLLRWHYAIDVVAGLALALSVAWLVPRLVAHDDAFREQHRLATAWSL